MKPADVTSTCLIVRPAPDPTTLTLSVYPSSSYGSGMVVFAVNGTIKQVSLPGLTGSDPAGSGVPSV